MTLTGTLGQRKGTILWKWTYVSLYSLCLNIIKNKLGFKITLCCAENGLQLVPLNVNTREQNKAIVSFTYFVVTLFTLQPYFITGIERYICIFKDTMWTVQTGY